MYYECTRCGTVDRLCQPDSGASYRSCLNCEGRTLWTVAFEGEVWPA